jgi:hypothetical protein
LRCRAAYVLDITKNLAGTAFKLHIKVTNVT